MILDGKKESIKIREEIKKEIFSIKSNKKKVPGLSVILIGDFAPSQIYVRNKEKNAKEVGINSEVIKYPKDVSEEDLLNKIKDLNQLKEFSGLGYAFDNSRSNEKILVFIYVNNFNFT